MSFKMLSLGAALILSTSQLAEADSITLQPSKDNTIIQQTNPATQLSNGQGDIFVGRTAQDGAGPTVPTISIRRGLVSFDIAGNIPAGSVITSVTLTMRDVMGLNGDPTIELRRMQEDWGEGGSFQNGGMGAAAQDGDATWLYSFYNAANPSLSPTWANGPGGNFSSTVSGSAVVFDDLGGGQQFSWASTSNPLMLADVQSWLDSPAGNFGWLLKNDELLGQTAKRFNSGESATLPNIPPALTIVYTVPEPSGAALAGLAALGAVITRVIGRRRR